MNSDQAFEIIERIGSTSSTTAKVKALVTHDCDTLRRILRATVHPYLTYGITPTLVPTHGFGHFTEGTWGLLKALNERALTGNRAHEAVSNEMERLTPISALLLYRIINKDLRAGIGDGLVDKAFPGMLPKFSPMLAHKYDSSRLSFPAVVQVKLDGLRALAFLYVKEKKAAFFTRTGRRFTSVPHLEEHLATAILDRVNEFQSTAMYAPDVIVFDGELTSGSFLDSVSALRKKDEVAEDAVFNVFDVMTGPQFAGEVGTMPLNGRINDLRLILPAIGPGVPIGHLPFTVVADEDAIFEIYADFRQKGLEGVIVKPLNSPYERKRSYNWMKIKAEESEDLTVIDAFEGTGKYAGTFGGFVVTYLGKSVRVGSGLTDDIRDELWRQHKAGLKATGQSGLAGRIVEVAYHEVTPDGSLRHPRFKRFRDVVEKGVKV